MAGRRSIPTEFLFLGNTTSLEAAYERAAAGAQETSQKMVYSARDAAKAAAEQAKSMGASSDVIAEAAARAAAGYRDAAKQVSASAVAAANAMADMARKAGASADEVDAAWNKQIAASMRYEKAQADAAKASEEASARQVAAAKKASDAAEAAAAKQSKSAVKLASTIGKWTLGAGLAAGYFGVKGATNLQSQMERLHTQAGVSQPRVTQLTQGVLNMSPDVATGPNALAQAMYHVTSSLDKTLPAVSRNATELKVLRTAAEGAKVGGADLVDVTNALDAAVVSGIRGTKNYTQAMGSLNSIVGAGDMTMQNLADALGTGMLGPMKTYGLSIKDIGGALAVFGDNNIRGQEAATKLTSAVRIMAAPSKEAAKALGVVGISSTQLADDMRRGGIVQAIDDLKTHLEQSGLTASQQALIITRAFGGRQSTGVQLLVGQLDRLRAKTQQVGDGAHTFNNDWVATTHTFKFQLDQLGASAQTLGDKFGMVLIPDLESVMHVTSDVVGWLGKHRAAADALAVTVGGVLTASIATYAYTKATAFITATKGMASGVQSLARAVGITASEIEASDTAIDTSNATTGASFDTVTADAATAGASLDSEWAGYAASIEATNAEIQASNAATADSFAAVDAAAAGGGAAGAAGGLTVGGAIGGTAAGLGAAFAGFMLASAIPKGQNPMAAAEKTGQYDPYGPNTSPVPKPGSSQYVSPNAQHASRDSIMALAELRKQIAAIKDPATLSATQLGHLYKEAQHLAGMKGVTAKQHAAVARLESALSGATGTGTGTGLTLSKSWLHAATGIGGLSSTEQTNAAAIMASLTRAGLSTAGAAALTGNWVQESGLNPNEQGGLLAQWGGSRLTNEQAWAKSHGMAYNTIPAETSFTMHELQSTPGLLQMLQSGKYSPQQLALAVENKYEEPKGTLKNAGYFSPDTYWSANTAGREQYASDIYSAFSGKQTSGALVGTTPSASTLAAYNALVGSGSGTTGGKATMRYYNHQPVGVMTEAQWQAWQHQNGTAKTRSGAVGAISTTIGGDVTRYQDLATSASTEAVKRLYLGTAAHIKALGVKFEGEAKSASTAAQESKIKAAFKDALTAITDGVTARVRVLARAAVDAKTGTNLIARFQSITQNGTPLTLDRALGVNTSARMAGLPEAMLGYYRENNMGVPTVSQYARSQIESMGRNPSQREIFGRLAPALTASGSAAQSKYEQQVSDLRSTGQNKLADRLVAAHKAAMQALALTMYAEQVTKDGKELEQQSTAMKDQTTAIQNAMQNAQTVFQAQEQKANDASQAIVQGMQDQQRVLDDMAASVVQHMADIAQVRSDQSQSVVDAINDQTQTQVDQIGEKGLYGLTLLAQQDRVIADQTKAQWDQVLDTDKQNLDVAKANAGVAEAAAQLNLDQVTAAEHAAVALAQGNVDTVTLSQDMRVASAQAHADATQLHVDSTLIGPAQIAVDMNANASKAVQDKMAAQLAKATGQGDQQVALADKQLALTRSDAQTQINLAQQQYDATNNQATQLIQGAQNNLQSVTDSWNQIIQGLQNRLTGDQGAAAQAEAAATGAASVAGAQASTQFAGSGLNVNIYGADLSSPTALSQEVSWAIRQANIQTV